MEKAGYQPKWKSNPGFCLSSQMCSLARRRVIARDQVWYYNEDKDSNLHLNVSTFLHSIFCLDWPLFLGCLHTRIMLSRGREREREREEVCSLPMAVGCSASPQWCKLTSFAANSSPQCKRFAKHSSMSRFIVLPLHCCSAARNIPHFFRSHKAKENSSRQVKWIFLKLQMSVNLASVPPKAPQLTQFDSPLQKCLDFCKSCNLAGLNHTSLAYTVISSIS